MFNQDPFTPKLCILASQSRKSGIGSMGRPLVLLIVEMWMFKVQLRFIYEEPNDSWTGQRQASHKLPRESQGHACRNSAPVTIQAWLMAAVVRRYRPFLQTKRPKTPPLNLPTQPASQRVTRFTGPRNQDHPSTVPSPQGLAGPA